MITTNSLGQRIAKTDEQIVAFWRWFGDSAAREPLVHSKERWADKRPLVLYHGTKHDFTSFRPKGVGTVSHTFGSYTTERHGVFFAENAAFASSFALQGDDSRGGRVIAAYLRVENPLDLTSGLTEKEEDSLRDAGVNIRWLNNLAEPWEAFDGADGAAFVAALKKAGFDGVMMEEENPDSGEREPVWVVFSPAQIKSATGNRGTFDPADPVMTNPLVRLLPAKRLSAKARRQLAAGARVEREHTRSRRAARIIASHHLAESPRYYRELAKMERRMRRNPAPFTFTGSPKQIEWATRIYDEAEPHIRRWARELPAARWADKQILQGSLNIASAAFWIDSRRCSGMDAFIAFARGPVERAILDSQRGIRSVADESPAFQRQRRLNTYYQAKRRPLF